MPVNIVRATIRDLWAVTRLALLLWPAHETQALYEEMQCGVEDPERALFVAKADGIAVGFALCSLRHDYVEGTDSNPVGYLEGIYVEENYRGKHIGTVLVKACEGFAGEQGCTEFASDCELHNQYSIHFHQHTGFSEVNRIVCFVKKL